MTVRSEHSRRRGLSRRSFLGATASAVAATAWGGDVGARDAPPSAAHEPGRAMLPLSERSRFEHLERQRWENLSGTASTPLEALHGTLTPSDAHFTRHHAGIPDIDPQTYFLLIHGLVETAKVFSLHDLKRMPSRTRIHFIECAGNGVAAFRDFSAGARRPSDIDGGTSNSEWTGVPLSVLLNEVGLKREARWFLAESQDGARYARSIPIDKGLDDAVIAYAQNGEALRSEQGYPVRLLLPGWEGSASVKWLRRIKIGDRPTMTREETARYTDIMSDGHVRMFAFEMEAKSIITTPAFPERLQPGWREIRGLAWSGRGRIARVDVSVDGGRHWSDSELEAPVLPKAHTRFRFPWRWNGAPAVLMSRATDETGYTQPSQAQFRALRPAGTDYHLNHIRAWTVLSDGSVLFAPAA
jgi:sulfane dehydrogenase subunit SoxC